MALSRPAIAAGVILALGAGGGFAWWQNQQRLEQVRLQNAGGAARSAASPQAARNPALYKWKDEQGQWHITDRPPAQGAFEKVQVDPDTNVVPMVLPEPVADSSSH